MALLHLYLLAVGTCCLDVFWDIFSSVWNSWNIFGNSRKLREIESLDPDATSSVRDASKNKLGFGFGDLYQGGRQTRSV